MNREQVLNMFNEKIIIEENFKYFLKTDEHGVCVVMLFLSILAII